MGEEESGLAVVIGGAGDIGNAIAADLAKQAWVRRVVVADFDMERAVITANTIGDLGVASAAVHVDLRAQASIAELVAETGDASYVCASAGVFISDSALETSRDDFQDVLDVNLIGTFQAIQGYAREMVGREQGAIVAITSVAARQPRMLQAAYCASKAGLRQALRVLSMETTPHGVRINTVAPGPTDTQMVRSMAKDHVQLADLAGGSLESFRPRVPRGCLAAPTDIASAVTYLLSPAASHVSLQEVVVDGGELLGM